MIDKPIMIMLFMYAISFSALAGQYIIGDVFNLTLTDPKGNPIKSQLLTSINEATINSVTLNITSTSYTLVDVASAFVKAGNVLVELLLLLTGTYFFNVLWLLLGANDAALYVVAPMVAIYAIMLGNTIIAKIRGI